MAEGPEAKMRGCYMKSKVLEKLKECGDCVGKVVEEIVSDLTPFDVNDESVTAFEDRIE